MFTSPYALGAAMLIAQGLFNLGNPYWSLFGFVPGLLVGVAYVALHKKGMMRNEKLKALLVFLIVASISSFLVGMQQVGEYSLEFAMLVSAVLVLAYAVCGYLGLTLGSLVYAQVAGYRTRTPGSMDFMKNSYVLGVLMLAGEGVVNVLYKLITQSTGSVSGIAIIMAMAAGSMYTTWHKEKMPAKERFKALGVYIVIAVAVGVLSLWEKISSNPGMVALIGGVLFLIYAIVMYFAMGWGSSTSMKAIERQAAKTSGVA
jgi:peptidoglycan/LPS O-acetylase OafA/YrhL